MKSTILIIVSFISVSFAQNQLVNIYKNFDFKLLRGLLNVSVNGEFTFVDINQELNLFMKTNVDLLKDIAENNTNIKIEKASKNYGIMSDIVANRYFSLIKSTSIAKTNLQSLIKESNFLKDWIR